jgi:hypothetical protein
MLTLNLKPVLTDEETAALAGRLLPASAAPLVLREDADVWRPDGTLLLRFRKRVFGFDECRTAWRALRAAAVTTDNRGVAAGAIDDPGATERPAAIVTGTRYRPLKRDGTVSNTNFAKKVRSGVIGFFDRNVRIPYCRQTAFNINHASRFAAALPFIQSVSRVFQRELPERWAAQRAICDQTHPDFLIPGTVFTTVTVNRNWQTAVHKDAGDLPEGFGVLSALSVGDYDGCYFCFPQYGVAADLRTGDLLLGDVHAWHGNTPLRGRGNYERLSLVFYYRSRMRDCGSAEAELSRARSGLRTLR